MYTFGVRSREVLSTLHPDLQVLCLNLISMRDVALIEGHRSSARQQELLDQGKTKVGPGRSKHNLMPSEAVDMLPYPFTEQDWNDRDKFHLFAGYVLAVADMLRARGAMERRVRWGGDWDRDWEASDNVFDDFPHFELIKD